MDSASKKSGVRAVDVPLMNRGEALRLGIFDFFSIVIGLKTEPETGTGAEETRQPHGGVCRDGPFAITYGGDPCLRNSNFFCQAILAYSHRDQEFFPQDFAGVDIGKLIHGVTSVIVAYFDPTGRPVAPDKADTPLVVDSYAPLSIAVAGELFQPVLRRNTKVVNPADVVQHT